MSTGDNGAEVVPTVATGASTPRRCRVLLADDHELVLDLLRSLLEQEFEVIGAAADGNILLQLTQELGPDIVLLDMVMPGLGGLEAAKALRAAGCRAKLVFLTMEIDPALAAEAFTLGASAYLAKASSSAELLRVLHLVAAGGRYLTPAIANGDIEALCASRSADPLNRVSVREMEVLKLLVAGMSMKAVARQLNIVPRTVAFHKYRAMEALGLRGNSDLIDFAIRHGLLRGKPAHSIAESAPARSCRMPVLQDSMRPGDNGPAARLLDGSMPQR